MADCAEALINIYLDDFGTYLIPQDVGALFTPALRARASGLFDMRTTLGREAAAYFAWVGKLRRAIWDQEIDLADTWIAPSLAEWRSRTLGVWVAP